MRANNENKLRSVSITARTTAWYRHFGVTQIPRPAMPLPAHLPRIPLKMFSFAKRVNAESMLDIVLYISYIITAVDSFVFAYRVSERTSDHRRLRCWPHVTM